MMNEGSTNNKPTIIAMVDSINNSGIHDAPNKMIFQANKADITMSMFCFYLFHLTSILASHQHNHTYRHN